MKSLTKRPIRDNAVVSTPLKHMKVSLDDYSHFLGKSEMFQTTNQLIIVRKDVDQWRWKIHDYHPSLPFATPVTLKIEDFQGFPVRDGELENLSNTMRTRMWFQSTLFRKRAR